MHILLFQIPNDILRHPVDILHGIEGCDLIFIVTAVWHAPEIPCKVLPSFQTGDVLPVILLRQPELLYS